MKNVIVIFVAILSVSFYTNLNAQTARLATNDLGIRSFYMTSKYAHQEIGRLANQALKIKASSAYKIKLRNVLISSYSLSKKIASTRGRMSKYQYVQYQKQLNGMINQLTNIGGSGEGPAGCMKECDEAYPGLGGGNGWNRFLCKASCLIIK